MKKYLVICFFILLNIEAIYAENFLNLETCKTLAIQNNTKLKNSQLELDAAKQVKQAAFTQFFPSISAQGMSFQAPAHLMEIHTQGGNLPVYDGNPANLANATQFAYFPDATMGLMKNATFGLINIVHPIYTGGRIINGNKLASLGESVAEYKLHLTQNEILLKTEEQYWQIVALHEKLKTLEAYHKLLGSLLRQVEDAYAAGIIGKNDVLKVKLKQNEVLLNQSKLENGIKLATLAFCQYIGIPYDKKLILTDTLQLNDIEPIDHVLAVKTRDEYHLLQAAIDAETLQTQLKLGEYLPQVGIGFTELYLQIDSGSSQIAGIIYGNIKIPISNWWEASYALSEHNKKEQIAQNNLKDTMELLTLQMEKAWQDLENAKKHIILSEDTQKQVLENLKVNQDSYKSGLTTVSDLLEAEAMLQNAMDQLTEAKTQYQVKKSTYLQVTGR